MTDIIGFPSQHRLTMKLGCIVAFAHRMSVGTSMGLFPFVIDMKAQKKNDEALGGKNTS